MVKCWLPKLKVNETSKTVNPNNKALLKDKGAQTPLISFSVPLNFIPKLVNSPTRSPKRKLNEDDNTSTSVTPSKKFCQSVPYSSRIKTIETPLVPVYNQHSPARSDKLGRTGSSI